MRTSPNSQPKQCRMLLLITQVLSSVDCLTTCSSPAQPSECPRWLCQARCVCEGNKDFEARRIPDGGTHPGSGPLAHL